MRECSREGGRLHREVRRTGRRPTATPSRHAEAAGLIAPGLAMIAVTYGLARFAYGLFVPQLRDEFDLSASALGLIGAGSYAGYCGASVLALALTSRAGPRRMVVVTGVVAVLGTATIAAAPGAAVLAIGVVLAGSSTGLVSPAMGEAVAIRLPAPNRDRANALINSGTSIGVAVSGPVALLVADQWRIAWAGFAVLGLGALWWNARTLPTAAGHTGGHRAAAAPPRLSWRFLVGTHSIRLLAVAAGLGFASAAYWTFSRELVVEAGHLGPAGSTLFWTVIGTAGLAGGAAGDLIRRFGLAAVLAGALSAMAVATALLGAAPAVLPLSYLSAAVFGSTYIMLTGIVLVWSVTVFARRPSAGLGAAFLMIAAGQVAGAPVAGELAGLLGLRGTFLVFALVTVLLVALRPRIVTAGTLTSHRAAGREGARSANPGPDNVRHESPGGGRSDGAQ